MTKTREMFHTQFSNLVVHYFAIVSSFPACSLFRLVGGRKGGGVKGSKNKTVSGETLSDGNDPKVTPKILRFSVSYGFLFRQLIVR